MSPSSPVIRTENLTRRFGELTAVDRLCIHADAGELVGLVGSDGAGKTTTLRMLAGILDPTEGSARMLGRDPFREAEAIRPDIGYMSQRFGLYPDLTVMENLRFYSDLFGVPARERRARMERLLEFSNLAPFVNRRAGNLSGGMKQKLGLACALIHTPKILLLDEPTNGVDPVSRRDFWRILNQLLRDGVTILVATAYLDEAERCHRVAFLHQGRLLACDTPQRLKSLVSGTILQLRTPNPRAAAHLLRERLPEYQVGLFGDRIHLVAADPAAAEAKTRQALPPTTPLSFTAVEPSLEDVFIAVMAGASR